MVPEAATVLFLNGASPDDFSKAGCAFAFQQFVIKYVTMQYGTVLYCVIYYDTLHFSTERYTTVYDSIV